MNLVEGIQSERKRVEELRKEYVALPGNAGQLAIILNIDPALKEADECIASGDVVRMLGAYSRLQEITG